EELAAYEHRSLPLCIAFAYKGTLVDSTLIDTRASVNVCPLSTMRMCGISEAEMKPTPTTVAAYDNSRRPCHGTIDIEMELGPLVIPVTFYIVDIDPAYKAILGRTWLRDTKAVSSTTHQRVKFKWKNRNVNIKSEPVSVADELPVNFIPTLWPSVKP